MYTMIYIYIYIHTCVYMYVRMYAYRYSDDILIHLFACTSTTPIGFHPICTNLQTLLPNT